MKVRVFCETKTFQNATVPTYNVQYTVLSQHLFIFNIFLPSGLLSKLRQFSMATMDSGQTFQGSMLNAPAADRNKTYILEQLQQIIQQQPAEMLEIASGTEIS